MTLQVRVEYAITEADDLVEPTSWLLAGYREETGSVRIVPQRSGVRIWTRARTEDFPRYLPSGYTTPTSFIYEEHTPAMYAARVVLSVTGLPTFTWAANDQTAGVLVEWSVHSIGGHAVYSSSLELDAADELVTLAGVVVGEEQEISVRVTPYTIFGGGSVSGTAGLPLIASAHMTDAPIGSGFDAGFDASFS